MDTNRRSFLKILAAAGIAAAIGDPKTIIKMTNRSSTLNEFVTIFLMVFLSKFVDLVERLMEI